jgi:DNA repair protein RadC
MSISDWPQSERPREKLLARGVASLSDAELLAIFLRTGIAGKTAVDLARDLLLTFGSLRALLKASRDQFCAAKGLGDAKYCQLQAVLEMSRRHLSEQLQQASVLESPAQVRAYLRSQLGHRQQEVFAVLFLSSQNHLLAYEELFFGSVSGASVYPREVVKKSLALNASALILCHNHPSGIAEPSNSDKRITERLVQALNLVDIRVLDHMIVGDSEVVSFAEQGLL